MVAVNRKLQSTPLWRDANRLLLAIEKAVRYFPRYHKYALGAEMHRQAMGVWGLFARACNDKANRSRLVARMVAAVDDLKIQIRLAKELRVFVMFMHKRMSRLHG